MHIEIPAICNRRVYGMLKLDLRIYVMMGCPEQVDYSSTYPALGSEYVHVIVWRLHTGRDPLPGLEIDHKYRDRLDARVDSLREVTRQMNAFNRKQLRPGMPTGVHRSGNKYKAVITIDSKYIYLGRFDSIDQAAIARREEEIRRGIKPYS